MFGWPKLFKNTSKSSVIRAQTFESLLQVWGARFLHFKKLEMSGGLFSAPFLTSTNLKNPAGCVLAPRHAVSARTLGGYIPSMFILVSQSRLTLEVNLRWLVHVFKLNLRGIREWIRGDLKGIREALLMIVGWIPKWFLKEFRVNLARVARWMLGACYVKLKWISKWTSGECWVIVWWL